MQDNKTVPAGRQDRQEISASDDKQLSSGDDELKLESGDDLAKKALANASSKPTSTGSNPDEVEASDQFAETLNALQNVVERNANQLTELNEQLKETRQMLRNVFDNDQQLQEAQDEAQKLSLLAKERKALVSNNPQATDLKIKIGELNERKKELEDTLSNHLVNYYQMTNSTSFDTSDGDQWEYTIKAKVKPRRKKS